MHTGHKSDQILYSMKAQGVEKTMATEIHLVWI